MESLLPSEIARLVYGYLIEEDCDAAAQLFLDTSAHLKECLSLHKKGRKFNTRVMGLALVDILNLYTDAVCMVKNYKENKSLEPPLSDFIHELENILFLDSTTGQNISKTVFLRISVPKNKLSRVSDDLSKEKEDLTEKPKELDKKNDSLAENEEVPTVKNNSSNSNLDDFDLNMLQALLDNTALHERIAENINKAIDSSGEISSHKTDEKKIIETILHNTEADPIFNELLHELVGPRVESSTTPEDTDKENGDPSEDRTASHVPPNNEDAETTKKIEEVSNLAIEGILAGNKKIQQEKALTESHALDPVLIAASQVVGTTPAGCKQTAIIIPPGYTVTGVIPASQAQTVMSTPLQPLKGANMSSFGQISPIQAQQDLTIPTASVRGGLQPRRRRILPKKLESFCIHVPLQNDNITHEVTVEIPSPAVKNVPEVIKRSRVRTRGGIQKVGTRGRVKAIGPHIATTEAVDSKIDVVFEKKRAQKQYSSGSIRTRSMLKKQKEIPEDNTPLETLTEESNELQQVEVIESRDPSPVEEKIKDSGKEAEDGTPEPPLTTVLTKKRVSLSTPRRNHVRVLDFTTPMRELVVRKSLTSPKVYHNKEKESKSLENIKRGIFNTPPKNNPLESPKENEKKKKKMDWDADLRKFVATNDSMDIPTSVGLKRKNGLKNKDKGRGRGRRKVVRGKLAKKASEEKLTSNDELVNQIEKEVRDVIGEDELILNTSQTSEMSNLIEEKLVEEMKKGEALTCSTIEANEVSDSESEDESRLNSATPKQNVNREVTQSQSKPLLGTSSESGGSDKEANKKDSKESEGSDKEGSKKDRKEESEVGDKEVNKKDSKNNPETDTQKELFNTSTPLKLVMSPVNENSKGQLTPTTKLMMQHLGKSSPRYLAVFSPSSQSSLENILIKECSRMESMKTSDVIQDIRKLDDPKMETENSVPSVDKPIAPGNHNIRPSPTFESIRKSGDTLLQTPAKFMTAPFPPGLPVEMTPLTKVLAAETSILTTALVTPTLPPTPRNISAIETPEKVETSPNLKNVSGDNDINYKESIEQQKITTPEGNIMKDIEKHSIKNIYPEASKVAETKENSGEQLSKNVCEESQGGISECHISSTELPDSTLDDNLRTSPRNVEKQNSDKCLSRTPRIKLSSPKIIGSNSKEHTVEKKLQKLRKPSGLINDSLLKQSVGLQSKKCLKNNITDDNTYDPNRSGSSDSKGTGKKLMQKQLTVSKKQSPGGTNSKSSKKSSKQDEKEKKKKLNDSHEQEIINQLLKEKARIFGPDNSSDSSDSSDIVKNESPETKLSFSSGLKGNKIPLQAARERLQKLENIRMLYSSTSTEESSDEEIVWKNKSVEDGNDNDSSKSKKNIESDCINKGSIIEVNEAKQKEDSGRIEGSTEEQPSAAKGHELRGNSNRTSPSLHTLKKSNYSSKLEIPNIDNAPSKKSPPKEDSNTNKNIKKPSTSETDRIQNSDNSQEGKTKPRDSTKCDIYNPAVEAELHSVLNPEIISYKQLKSNEQVFHIKERTDYSKELLKSKFSDSSEKLNQARCNAISEYLDNYVFSFTLDIDKSGNYITKDLHTSPFLNIFEYCEKPNVQPDHSKLESSRSDHRSYSTTKSRKRHRSASSSEEEKKQRDHSRSSKYKGGRVRQERRGNRATTGYRRDTRDSRFHKRNHDNRHRDSSSHFSQYDKKRSRRSSPDLRRPPKKLDRRKLEEKSDYGKYDKGSHGYDKRYTNPNDTLAGSKSSETDLKHLDSPYKSDTSPESPRDRTVMSKQRLGSKAEEQPFYFRADMKSHKGIMKEAVSCEREEGELSDSSEIKRRSPAASGGDLAVGTEDSRASLLKKVDLDHFLSIVHGKKK